MRKIITCGNLQDYFNNWLLLNYAGMTYYFINWLLFNCAGLTKEELQESTEVNSFELWIIQFSFGEKRHFWMNNFTLADVHNIYFHDIYQLVSFRWPAVWWTAYGTSSSGFAGNNACNTSYRWADGQFWFGLFSKKI